MKRSDISDEHVLELARQDIGVYAALVAEGIPSNLALAKIRHMVRRGLLEYGTSEAYAWPAEPPSGDDRTAEWERVRDRLATALGSLPRHPDAGTVAYLHDTETGNVKRIPTSNDGPHHTWPVE